MKKTSQYVKRYQLDKSDEFNHHKFIQDLGRDFNQLCVLNRAGENRKKFSHTVDEIRDKFNAINNKTVGNINEKVWSYFYASKVIPKKKLYFGEDTIAVAYG